MTATTGLAAPVDLSSGTATIRLAILTGRDPAQLATARATALGACADVVLVLTEQRHASFIERAEAIREARPDVVLIVADAGDANGVIDLAESLRLACEAKEPPPTVLVAADERTRARLAASLARMPEEVPDPRTNAGREAIVARLRAMRRRTNDELLRDEAVERAARSLAAAASLSTVIVDVTGSSTSVVLAAAGGATVAVHAPLGVGATADRVVARSGLDRVRRWIPRAIDAPALLERVFNRTRWPDIAPTSAIALSLEMALARECVSRLLAEAERALVEIGQARTADWVVCTGRLASWTPSQSVLVAVDALAPDGITLVSREDALAPVIAGGQPRALALVASLWPRRSATVRVVDGTGATDERIARGAFLMIPTTGGVEVTIAGTPSRATADSLAVGVVVDARGRPFELPARDGERVPALVRWHTALDALPFGSDEP